MKSIWLHAVIDGGWVKLYRGNADRPDLSFRIDVADERPGWLSNVPTDLIRIVENHGVDKTPSDGSVGRLLSDEGRFDTGRGYRWGSVSPTEGR